MMNDVLIPKKTTDQPKIALIVPKPDPILKRLRQWGMSLLANLIHPTMSRFGDDSYHKGLKDVWEDKNIKITI